MPSAPTSTPTSAIESVALGVASPETIREEWSFGEVKNGETLDLQSEKPIVGGLFCEQIFGPREDWKCACEQQGGTERGSVCHVCRVELTEAKVRRERMGHIELAAPVAHIWFRMLLPSPIGVALNLKVGEVERVLNFESFLVLEAGQTPLNEHQLLDANAYRDAQETFGADAFIAKAGAEGLRDALAKFDLPQLVSRLQEASEATKSSKVRTQLAKRIKHLSAFAASNLRPEWMIMTVLPVLPPDLRPLVKYVEHPGLMFPLPSGEPHFPLLGKYRFTLSGINQSYQEIIKQNNELKCLLASDDATELQVRDQIRKLQHAVDVLFDSGRSKSRGLAPASGPRLKSFKDELAGKRGHFRNALLGKRVDYSGRSVIVVGPELKLHQCGLPKKLALTLFEPFVIRQLIGISRAENEKDKAKEARRLFKTSSSSSFQVLRAIVEHYPVLINRAPTLHRHSIQAFEAVLVEGDAIQLHPLVCSAYNADFDGDTVAVHVPLSVEAQIEARTLMMAHSNLLNPANGRLILTPSQDIVLGCYYLTSDPAIGPPPLAGPLFADCDQVRSALDRQDVRIHDRIRLANSAAGRWAHNGHPKASFVRTTVGRALFNEVLPAELGFVNEPVRKERLIQLIEECYGRCGRERTVDLLDAIKDLGFEMATKSGISIGMEDIVAPPNKGEVVAATRRRLSEIECQQKQGIIRAKEGIEMQEVAWRECSDSIQAEVLAALECDLQKRGLNPLWMMVDSKARGSRDQVRQLAGLRGLMLNAEGEAQAKPILSSFREGLSVEEVVISSNSVNKVQHEMAMATPNAGYFTRKLVNFAHDVVIVSTDCHTETGITLEAQSDDVRSLADRILGRCPAADLYDPADAKRVLARAGLELTRSKAQEIAESGVQAVTVRSAFTCQAEGGICSTCYGRNPATGHPAQLGDAVGIIAAQSLGEPATQLTLRLFHNGGTVKHKATPAPYHTGGNNLGRDEKQVEMADEDADELRFQEMSGLRRLDKLFSLNKASMPITKPREKMLHPIPQALLAQTRGCIEVGAMGQGKWMITVRDPATRMTMNCVVSKPQTLAVGPGDSVEVGTPLTNGLVGLQELLDLRGPSEVLRYVINVAQSIYGDDGVQVDDRHIELVVRQMLRFVEVVDAGDTLFTRGGLVRKDQLDQENDRVNRLGGMAARGKPTATGINDFASPDSGPLSNAGFAYPANVLTQATALGLVDKLTDARACIMTGRLVPLGTGFEAYRKIEPKATAPSPTAATQVIR